MIVKSLREVAERCCVSVDTVNEWRKRGMPGNPGSWDLTEIANWRSEKIVAKKATINTKQEGLAEERIKSDLRLKKVRAEREEAKLRKELGDLIDRHDVDQFFSEFFTELRRQSQRIPQEMCLGYPADIKDSLQEDIKSRIEMLLNSMATWAERISEISSEKS